MNNREPVYQMVLDLKDDLNWGVKFSHEFDGFTTPIFTIKTNQERSFVEQNFYFPGELYNEYRNFTLEFKNGYFLLSDEQLEFDLRFQIGLKGRYELYPSILEDKLLRSEAIFEYIGDEKHFVQNHKYFLVLLPMDLTLMDRMYTENKACFVGLTPNFGERYG